MAAESTKEKLYRIIFGTDTPAGKLFAVVLIYSIIISVFALMLDSVVDIEARFRGVLTSLEWFFTIAFTLEYAVRLYAHLIAYAMPPAFLASLICYPFYRLISAYCFPVRIIC